MADDDAPKETWATEAVDIVEERAEMPLPQNLQTILLVGIFGLLVLYTLYFTSAIVLPIVFAFVLYLLLQPSMRIFARLHVPKAIAALLIIVTFFGGVTALGFAVSGPASEWVAKAPETLPRLERRLSMFKKPLENLQRANNAVEKVTAGIATNVRPVTMVGPGLGSFLLNRTRAFIVGAFTTVGLLFFLLIAGDQFLRRLVEILPTLTNKKQAVDITREIESNVSGYLVTISFMNATVGIGTGVAAYLCGLSDPILWGTIAFLLNYIPFLGPLSTVTVLLLAGLSTFDTLWQAFLPAGIYFAIHCIEGETITPMLLARRFTLNPVLVIVSLVFWYWMWGIAGAFLAVPMLATTKIICDRVRPLMALGHFLGVEARTSASLQNSA